MIVPPPVHLRAAFLFKRDGLYQPDRAAKNKSLSGFGFVIARNPKIDI
jgi:hypothetical protein